jgi:hypothetical protein
MFCSRDNAVVVDAIVVTAMFRGRCGSDRYVRVVEIRKEKSSNGHISVASPPMTSLTRFHWHEN